MKVREPSPKDSRVVPLKTALTAIARLVLEQMGSIELEDEDRIWCLNAVQRVAAGSRQEELKFHATTTDEPTT